MCLEWLQYYFNEANCGMASAPNEILQRAPAHFHAGLQGYQIATRVGPLFHLHPGCGRICPFEHLHLLGERDKSGASTREDAPRCCQR